VELKEYQKESLTKVKTFIEWLKKAKIEADKRNTTLNRSLKITLIFPKQPGKRSAKISIDRRKMG